MKLILLTLVMGCLALTGCGTLALFDGGDDGIGVNPELSWRDAGKGDVPEEVATWQMTHEHCNWSSVVLLRLGWPIGEHGESIDNRRYYVRDPKSVLPKDIVRQRYSILPGLPKNVQDSGLRSGDISLFSTPGRDDFIYIVQGDVVERWPVAAESVACA
jgi:hypothetical protein